MIKGEIKSQKESSTKVSVPKGKALYEVSGTPFIVQDKYEIIKQIGSGAYGVVASALNRQTNKKVAIKKVINAFDDAVDAKRILRQIKLLKFLKHENIIGLVQVLRPESKIRYNDVYIVTDLMETDLHKVIYSKQQLSQEHIQYFIYQLLRGLLYMHSANILHRDLKPSNLLLNKKCDLKICDLGLARGYTDQQEEKTEYVVTRWYRAPQVILNASEYSKAVDIWSVGCIMAELLGRTPLFPGQSYLDQISRIVSILGTPSQDDLKYIGNDNALKYIKSLAKRSKQAWGNLFPGFRPQTYDLLEKMLTFNPDKRYTVQECLAHPYFDDSHNDNVLPVSSETFDWTWDKFQPTSQKLQMMIYEESLAFYPIQKHERPGFSTNTILNRYSRQKDNRFKHN